MPQWSSVSQNLNALGREEVLEEGFAQSKWEQLSVWWKVALCLHGATAQTWE